MNGEPFSDEQKEFIKANYRTKGCRWVAGQLGRTLRSVYSQVSSMGFTEHREFLTDDVIIAAIQELHPQGRTDPDVVKHLYQQHGLTTDRHRVGKLRRRLGLESNACSDHRRRQVSEKTKLQLQSAGFSQLCDLRIAQWNEWKRSLGWPDSLTVRSVQALECFWMPITQRLETHAHLRLCWKWWELRRRFTSPTI
ncbi:MAG: hypothetical protein U0930_03730 [Pirellulales bacterium]